MEWTDPAVFRATIPVRRPKKAFGSRQIDFIEELNSYILKGLNEIQIAVYLEALYLTERSALTRARWWLG